MENFWQSTIKGTINQIGSYFERKQNSADTVTKAHAVTSSVKPLGMIAGAIILGVIIFKMFK